MKRPVTLCSNLLSADERVLLVAGSFSYCDAALLCGGLPEKIQISSKDLGIPYGVLHLPVSFKFADVS